MQPIVDGLRQEFGTQVEFLSFNALDGAQGEAIFAQLGMPGHPGIALYTRRQEQAYWAVGVANESDLRLQLDLALNESK